MEGNLTTKQAMTIDGARAIRAIRAELQQMLKRGVIGRRELQTLEPAFGLDVREYSPHPQSDLWPWRVLYAMARTPRENSIAT